MASILEVLSVAQKASQFALEMQGRSFGLQFATVTNNRDPLNLRRIKCTSEAKGGLTETDWLMAMRLIPNYDPPMPEVGTSVVIGFVDGDPHDGIWLGPVVNRTNPQDNSQADPVRDNSQTIPGNSSETIGGDSALTVKGRWEIVTEKFTYHKTQLLMEDLLRLQLAEGLPAASEANRGKMLVVKGLSGVPDRTYICLRNANGTYKWVNFASGDS